jgi:hypothetical protein
MAFTHTFTGVVLCHILIEPDPVADEFAGKTVRYCWPTYIKVLGVLFLGEVSSAFLPSKEAC